MPDAKNIIIFDLDGTLALIEHRVHHITAETPDWQAFYAACVDDLPHSRLSSPPMPLPRRLTKYGLSREGRTRLSSRQRNG